MAKKINRLTVKTIDNLKRPGYHADGDGLYLQVLPTGGKSWLYRYKLNGRQHWMGLGGLRDVGLEAARRSRDEARALLKGKDRVDPVAHRQAQRRQVDSESAKAKTFDECAGLYIEAHKAAWRNEGPRGDKYAREWRNTLNTYASPEFGNLPVQAIDAGLVIAVLDPIWRTKTETANRVRGRVEAILDFATVRGWRAGENPARWRGHLALALPKKSRVTPIQHRAAMPYSDVPAFCQTLRTHDGTAARALEFLILTAVRTGEAVGATWAEINLENRVWTVPASRMKGGKVHRVPMSDAAMAVLRKMEGARQNDFVFPGQREGRPLTIAAPLKQLHDLGHDDLTVHGFRSSFRDWAGEQTGFPREVCEAALAHVVGSATEAAYQRSDLFDKRAKLLQVWATYCSVSRKATVVQISKRNSL